MKLSANLSALLVLLPLIGGCVSGYTKFYHDHAINVNSNEYVLSNDEPKITKGNDADTDSLSMLSDGYVMIGYSSFNGKLESTDNAIVKAKEIGATHIIVYSKYTGTVSSFTPLFTPGAFGTINTSYMPMSVNRLDQGATYWVKKKKWNFGAGIGDVPDDMKQKYGSNKGAYLGYIVKNSPAYNADIGPRDIVTHINGEQIISANHMLEILNRNNGKEIQITLWRDNGTYEKKLTLLGI